MSDVRQSGSVPSGTPRDMSMGTVGQTWARQPTWSPYRLKVRRGRQKDAIEELNRLHVARRIEPYDEAPPGPGAAIARGRRST